MDRVADNHYATSELDAIKARDIQSIAADDCVLFLWSTAPMQPQAYEVMAAWGFDYKSQTIWDKGELGTGYWFRNQHEVLLVGTLGAIPPPAAGTRWPSIIQAAVASILKSRSGVGRRRDDMRFVVGIGRGAFRDVQGNGGRRSRGDPRLNRR